MKEWLKSRFKACSVFGHRTSGSFIKELKATGLIADNKKYYIEV
jgi:hypothetical protein